MRVIGTGGLEGRLQMAHLRMSAGRYSWNFKVECVGHKTDAEAPLGELKPFISVVPALARARVSAVIVVCAQLLS